MIEMVLLKYVKETDKKLRWDAEVGEVKFELYIPKWRVPEPWPSRIYVGIEPAQPKKYEQRLTRTDAEENASLKAGPIVTLVRFFKDHKDTLRYRPIGDSNEWEIGEPYIPYDLTHDRAEYLQLTVEWGLRSEKGF